jgi:hypothetical protein
LRAHGVLDYYNVVVPREIVSLVDGKCHNKFNDGIHEANAHEYDDLTLILLKIDSQEYEPKGDIDPYVDEGIANESILSLFVGQVRPAIGHDALQNIVRTHLTN